MVRLLIITTLALLCCAPPCAAAPPVPNDLQRMEGTWKVKYAEKANKPVPSEEAMATQLRITGPVLSILVDGKVVTSATLALENSKEQRNFKMMSPDGKQSVLGIYKIEGDEEIRLCWDNSTGKRPIAFSGINDSGSLVYFRLVKSKP